MSKRHNPAVQKLLETMELTHIKDKQTTEQTLDKMVLSDQQRECKRRAQPVKKEGGGQQGVGSERD